MLVYPWWGVLTAYVGLSMVTSVVMATTFQLAHCVEEAGFATPAELIASKRVWAVHEVETTVDFCPRNKLLTWMLGGLNYQIEHHLFPRIPHTLYPEIAPIVQRNCLRYGVRYTVQPSLRLALALALPPPSRPGPRRASRPSSRWADARSTQQPAAPTPEAGCRVMLARKRQDLDDPRGEHERVDRLRRGRQAHRASRRAIS